METQILKNATSISFLNNYLLGLNTNEGHNLCLIDGTGVFKSSTAHKKQPSFYEPLICLVTQGEKLCHVGDESFLYRTGDFFINMLPMPVVAEITKASDEEPFIAVTLSIDLVNLADTVLKIERLEENFSAAPEHVCSCLLVGKADEGLIETFYRLMVLNSNKLDATVLGETTVNEIYYRILTSNYGYALRQLLSQFGQIQPISKAVSYIHNNIDRNIPIQELASLSNMSKTSFFNTFKKLMHAPPNQYIKSSKLQKAKTLLIQGMQANEASHHVGYNSFSQFSREYKRLFGFPPSQTQVQSN